MRALTRFGVPVESADGGARDLGIQGRSPEYGSGKDGRPLAAHPEACMGYLQTP
ncbi:MAG TPA: hypothetical protein VNA32_06010 [Actinomycetota bacterium]|nr:hypothetical protein [Actinomycetota bacterium]